MNVSGAGQIQAQTVFLSEHPSLIFWRSQSRWTPVTSSASSWGSRCGPTQDGIHTVIRLACSGATLGSPTRSISRYWNHLSWLFWMWGSCCAPQCSFQMSELSLRCSGSATLQTMLNSLGFNAAIFWLQAVFRNLSPPGHYTRSWTKICLNRCWNMPISWATNLSIDL